MFVELAHQPFADLQGWMVSFPPISFPYESYTGEQRNKLVIQLIVDQHVASYRDMSGPKFDPCGFPDVDIIQYDIKDIASF